MSIPFPLARPAEAAPSISGCEHCGLPAARGDRFCCYGCELAAELARESAQHEGRLKGVLSLCLVLSMAVMMFSLFLYAEDVYGATGSAAMARLRELYRLAAAILSTPVVLLCGAPLARRAWTSLRAGRLSMELLVVTGALAAYGLSIASILRGGSRVYFDSAISALILTTLGRYLEASARARASQALAPSISGQGSAVLVLDEVSGQLGSMAAAALTPGTRFRVPLEQRVPVDCELRGAAAEVNLAVITGESTPRLLWPGDRVPAGAVPVSGPIDCTALRSARDSTLQRLSDLARQLRERTSHAQRWADRFAAALVPATWAVALGTLWYWTSKASIERGVVNALAVVLAACPCTYGVIVPLTLWLALRRALAEGVLIRSASTLETLARVQTVAFDKTGTLTHPGLWVESVQTAGGCSAEEAVTWAASLEEGSPHPVARALVQAAGGKSVKLRERRFVPGAGVQGRLENGDEIFAGAPPSGAAGGDARVLLRRNGEVIARFVLGERIRGEASLAVRELSAQGVRSLVLTGDGDASALRAAAALGLPTFARLTAEQKVGLLGSFGRGVAMVGDGLNDAPALARAGASFALGEGSDLARGMSGVTLLRADLRLVPWTLRLARRTLRTIRQSFAASTVYNLAFLSLAAAGAFRPVWAGLSMLTSSLLILAFARRAARIDPLPEALGTR